MHFSRSHMRAGYTSYRWVAWHNEINWALPDWYFYGESLRLACFQEFITRWSQCPETGPNKRNDHMIWNLGHGKRPSRQNAKWRYLFDKMIMTDESHASHMGLVHISFPFGWSGRISLAAFLFTPWYRMRGRGGDAVRPARRGGVHDQFTAPSERSTSQAGQRCGLLKLYDQHCALLTKQRVWACTLVQLQLKSKRWLFSATSVCPKSASCSSERRISGWWIRGFPYHIWLSHHL